MIYKVIWSPTAEAGLAEAWLDAPNRNEVSDASSLIDITLRQRPFRLGSPLASSVNRRAEIPPLAIVFDIVEDDKKVIVQTCWLVG